MYLLISLHLFSLVMAKLCHIAQCCVFFLHLFKSSTYVFDSYLFPLVSTYFFFFHFSNILLRFHNSMRAKAVAFISHKLRRNCMQIFFPFPIYSTTFILWFNKWNWKRNDLLMPIIELCERKTTFLFLHPHQFRCSDSEPCLWNGPSKQAKKKNPTKSDTTKNKINQRKLVFSISLSVSRFRSIFFLSNLQKILNYL